MEVIRAAHMGLCEGVSRACRLAYAWVDHPGGLYATGPVAHNRQLITALEQAGLCTVATLAELPPDSAFLVRAHGISRQEWAELEQLAQDKQVTVVDATCPCVAHIFQLAAAEGAKGGTVLLLGEAGHPEVVATASWAGANCLVVSGYSQVTALLQEAKLSAEDPVVLLVQSTLEQTLFFDFVEKLRRDFKRGVVFNTICPATQKRQDAAVALAQQVDLMLVIGGRHSANTRHLHDLCSRVNLNTLLLEEAHELAGEALLGVTTVGLTAGASTPEWIIEEVETKVTEWEKKEPTPEELAERKAEEKAVEELEPETQEQALQQPQEEEAAPETPEAAETLAPTELITATTEPTAEEATAPDTPDEITPEVAQPTEDALPEETTPEQEEEPTESMEEETSVGDLEEAMEMGAFDLPRLSIGDIIKATVVKIHADEVMVDVGLKSEGVIPRRELSIDTSLPADEIVKVGEEIEVEVFRSEDQEGRITFSKRRADQQKHWGRVIEAFENEEIIEGKVLEVVKGGLLVDIGVRGFMPASQAERRYTNDLKHLVGETVRLKLLEVDPSRDKRRAIVSRKAVLDVEAEAAKQEFWGKVSEGDLVTGVVRRLTEFGAFVDLGGVDGLLHISDMAYHRVNKPSDIVAIGDELQLKVLKLNPEASRVSLGLKQMQPKPWEALSQELLQGDIIQGTVVRIAPWGAFVNVRPGIDGLIHISELDVQRVATVDDVVQIGDVIQAVVLSVNPEKERLSLSLRAIHAMQIVEEEGDYFEEEEAPDLAEEAEIFEEVEMAEEVEVLQETEAVEEVEEAEEDPEVTEPEEPKEPQV
ncbi:MAG: bifunctional 4-hydroxy-3-methylbut-2-enyl diphosphate reductase/30S ribosomal protein S1 [Symbiobacteriaceae bacterium]|nr:bifunctional 4-hydroxy-3-methylbut-2-enyl diphosphate reductase/30S ribosomal protein S1 [Symbiobacteriaceae bacterium]